MNLDIAAIEFGASGGTNFAKLELLRNENGDAAHHEELANIGHSAEEMVGFVNNLNSKESRFSLMEMRSLSIPLCLRYTISQERSELNHYQLLE